MTVRLPRLQAQTSYFSPDGRPTQQMMRFIQTFAETLEGVLNQILAIPAIEDALDDVEAATIAANAAAVSAQTAADNVTATQELANSFVSGLTITATDAGADVTVTISGHTRHYPQPDGTTTDVAVTGGNITALAYSTPYYLYYDQASRAGGAVTFVATTSATTAAQLGDRHTVGGVTTPAAAAPPETGNPTRPPGTGTFEV